jgi:flagellar M-ring protein FliF
MGKAREALGKTGGFIKGKWSAANKNTRIIVLAVFAAMLIATIMMIALSRRTDFEVLYTGVTAEEMGEIASALNGMGVTARVDGQTVSVPRDQVDRVRMDLAIEGFPRAAFNYNIWNDSIGMFSTDADRRMAEVHQLQEQLRATLRTLTFVQSAIVMITPATEDSFVFSDRGTPAQATVQLTLQPGARLTTAQIEGTQRLVMTAVPGLTMENLAIINQHGVELIPEDLNTAETALALQMQTLNMQTSFRLRYEENVRASIEELLRGTVKDFRVAVNAQLDFSNWETVSTTFEGANVDPETGLVSGIVDYSEKMTAWNAIGEDGNLVGAPINVDIAPGYPTLEAFRGSEAFFESVERLQYKVSEYHRVASSSGFEIAKVTIAVQIDDNTLPQDEIDEWRRLIANGTGTDFENVSVKTTNFILTTPTSQPPTIQPSSVRNLLVFVIISLGALLIILFMLAIMSSGSKKRKLIRNARMAAFQGAGASGSGMDSDEYGGYAFSKPVDDEPEEIKIQSLLGAGEGETRDALLKNEIREFAKTNPDIVAQLIRTWIRE